MKKMILLAGVALVLAAASFITGVFVGTPSDYSIRADYKQLAPLSTKGENQRLEGLGIGFPDEGDAAEIYIEFVQRDSPVYKEKFWEDSAYFLSAKPEEKQKVAQAVELASPHLDAALQASRMKECKLWGTHYKPNPEITYFAQTIPEYYSLIKVGKLLVARGNQLAADGQTDRALEHFTALIRMGHQMEREPVIIGNLIGIALKKTGAQALADYYEARGQAAEAAKWRLYLDVQDMRRVAFAAYSVSAPNWDRSLTAAFIDDEEIPYCYKLETLAAKRYCGDAYNSGSKTALYSCIVFGPPGWIDPLVDKFGARDELSGQFAQVIKTHNLGFKDISTVEVIQ